MNENSKGFLPSLWSDNPFVELRKEMDHTLERFFGNRDLSVSNGDFGKFVTPSVDVVENDGALTMTAELPGLEQNDIDLSIHNGVLTLKGEKKMEKKDEKDNYRLVERRYGSFQRAIQLPPSVDEAAVTAKFDKGVLTVTMPKRPGTAPVERKIAIEK
ncbi:Hsp20/alpha crystallin family protein [Pseudomonas sp. R2.Fl]|nr:Hsp20/alpha crystallin family protein [Pseudomonas sp. R2.Fl]